MSTYAPYIRTCVAQGARAQDLPPLGRTIPPPRPARADSHQVALRLYQCGNPSRGARARGQYRGTSRGHTLPTNYPHTSRHPSYTLPTPYPPTAYPPTHYLHPIHTLPTQNPHLAHFLHTTKPSPQSASRHGGSSAARVAYFSYGWTSCVATRVNPIP